MKYITKNADIEDKSETAAEARLGYPPSHSKVDLITSENGDTLAYVVEDLEDYLLATDKENQYDALVERTPVSQPVFDAFIEWLEGEDMLVKSPETEATLAEFGKSVLSIITDGQFLCEATLGRVLGKAIELKLIKEAPGGYVRCHD